MSARSVSLTTMFGWIPEAIRLLKNGKGALLAASLWMFAIVALSVMPLFTVMGIGGAFSLRHPHGFQPGWGFWLAEAVTVLASLAIYPALTAGWYRLCGAIADGRAARGRDIFAPFLDAALWGRSLRVMLLMIVAIMLLFCVIMLPFASQFIAFQHAAEAHRAAMLAGLEAPSPPFPGMMFLAYFVFILLAVFVQLVANIALGEVTARPVGAIDALSRSAQAVLGNFFKLLLFGFCVSSLVGAVLMVVMIPLVLIGLVLSFISPILLAIVVFLAYAAMLVVMYPLMYVFRFLLWRGLLGAEMDAQETIGV